MTITVEIADSQSVFDIDERLLREVVDATLVAEQVAQATISVALVDNQALRRLNRRHLDHDYDTDVLSFLLEVEEPDREAKPADSPRGYGKRLEGEVVLSVEMAEQSARDFGWSTGDEVVLYLVHGLLHLVGYDDLTDVEKSAMRERERDILKLWKLTPHYREQDGAPASLDSAPSQNGVSGADP